MKFVRPLLTTVMVLFHGLTWSQAAYPNKPITMIVPFPAGGIADVSARALKPSLERALGGQTVIVVNRPGASGALGAVAVANAAPDGYTLMYTLSSVASIPDQAVMNGQKAPFSLDQFVPIARVTTDVVAIVVKADSPYKTLNDLIAAARANPKGLTYSSSGNYGISHIPAEMLSAATNTESRHIPYAGGAPMITAVLGGTVDFNVPVRTLALPHVQSGRMRYLAMYGNSRWAQAPDVPSLGELGIKLDYVPWTGLFAPAGTPAEVLATLRRAMKAAVSEQQFQDIVKKSASGESAYLDGAELDAFWRQDVASTAATIKRIGKIE